jgi:hypothetical protein
MLLSRLKHYFAAHGADIRRWPKKPYEIWRRSAGSSRFSAERTEAEHLDRLLDLWKAEAPPERLAEHICRQTLGLPQRPKSASAARADVIVWPFASYWPGIASFGVALVMGCLLGWYGSGINTTPSEDWLNTAALSTLAGDFGER